MEYLMSKPILIVLATLALAACTPATRAVLNEGVERVKAVEDAKARLALQAPCSVSLGAFNRVLSADEQRAVMTLCGGNSERPVTVEDLQRFLAAPR